MEGLSRDFFHMPFCSFAGAASADRLLRCRANNRSAEAGPYAIDFGSRKCPLLAAYHPSVGTVFAVLWDGGRRDGLNLRGGDRCP